MTKYKKYLYVKYVIACVCSRISNITKQERTEKEFLQYKKFWASSGKFYAKT